MSPETMARLVRRWTRLYTLGVPAGERERRREEIAADLHDQIEHDRAQGVADRRIAGALLARTLRGLAADVSWRGRHAGSLAAIVAVVLVLLSVPAVATLAGGGGVAWGVLDFVAAGALLLGVGLVGRAVLRRTRDVVAVGAAGLASVSAFALVFGTLAVGPLGGPVTTGDVVALAVLTTLLVASTLAYRHHAGRPARSGADHLP